MGNLISRFPLASAVFLPPTLCPCHPKAKALQLCPLMHLTFTLKQLGVPLIHTKPNDSTDEIDPDFLDLVRRNKRVSIQAA